jgi:hypothetical protein
MWRSNNVIALVKMGQVEVVDFKGLFFLFQKSISTKVETVHML